MRYTPPADCPAGREAACAVAPLADTVTLSEAMANEVTSVVTVGVTVVGAGAGSGAAGGGLGDAAGRAFSAAA
jgi:hypothetical protein